MAKQNEQEPSLWDQAQHGLGQQDARRPERRLLPHDLDVALKYLSDGELKRLFETVNSEAQRRGLLLVERPEPEKVKVSRRKADPDVISGLTQAQINLIRSSIKAGVKPSVLARQFGLSQAQIRAALA
jgi:hypothetical protein